MFYNWCRLLPNCSVFKRKQLCFFISDVYSTVSQLQYNPFPCVPTQHVFENKVSSQALAGMSQIHSHYLWDVTDLDHRAVNQPTGLYSSRSNTLWGTFSQFPSGLRLSPLSQSDFQLLDGEKHLTCLASVNIPVFPRWTLAQQEEVESHPEVCANANKLRLDSIFFFRDKIVRHLVRQPRCYCIRNQSWIDRWFWLNHDDWSDFFPPGPHRESGFDAVLQDSSYLSFYKQDCITKWRLSL